MRFLTLNVRGCESKTWTINNRFEEEKQNMNRVSKSLVFSIFLCIDTSFFRLAAWKKLRDESRFVFRRVRSGVRTDAQQKKRERKNRIDFSSEFRIFPIPFAMNRFVAKDKHSSTNREWKQKQEKNNDLYQLWFCLCKISRLCKILLRFE